MSNHPNRSPVRLDVVLRRADRMRKDEVETSFTPRELLILTKEVSSGVNIGLEGDCYRLTSAGRDIIKIVDSANPWANRLLKLLVPLLGLSEGEALDAATRAGLDVTRSQVHGWRRHPADRKHCKMTLEQLESLLQQLLEDEKTYHPKKD